MRLKERFIFLMARGHSNIKGNIMADCLAEVAVQFSHKNASESRFD